MKAIIKNGISLRGVIDAPPSKSEIIRAAILLALSGQRPSEALTGYWEACVCDDAAAAAEACSALMRGPELLCVGESAALARMLLPVSLALYGEAHIKPGRRLFERGFYAAERCLGVELKREKGVLHAEKRLFPGRYYIDCSRSSQYLSGLLLALPLLEGDSEIVPCGGLVSAGYANMTLAYAAGFGARYGAKELSEGRPIRVYPSKYSAPREPLYVLENGVGAYASGDCSYAAFFLAANALGGGVRVRGISERTLQPDRAFASLVGREQIDITSCPDLLPPLAAAACGMEHDTVFTGTARLALKESDRANAMSELINALGGKAFAGEDELIVRGGRRFTGGVCSARGDHRLAMAAAVLAGLCSGPVKLIDAECYTKSAPDFRKDYKLLGGEYEFVWQ